MWRTFFRSSTRGCKMSTSARVWPYCLTLADMVPKHERSGQNPASPKTETPSNGLATNSRPDQIDLQFLGTASSQPTPTRAHNCLALRLGGEVWIFDAGESAQLQLAKSSMKSGKVSTIFITHLHGDHVFGLGPLVCSLAQAFGKDDAAEDEKVSNMDDAPIQLEIYGPLGTRAYLRNVLRYSYSFTSRRWRVHELIMPGEQPEDIHGGVPHPCEVVGNDLHADHLEDSIVFNDILVNDQYRSKHPFFTVCAAPIRHTVPTLGFVVQEVDMEGHIPNTYVKRIKANPGIPMSILRNVKAGQAFQLPDGTTLEPPSKVRGRKLCILGDTCDPSNIRKLAYGADVLIHEATNALLTSDGEARDNETFESVEESTISHGHSTPQMAGEFATSINASALLLNHFSGRYKGDADAASTCIMDEIRDLARSKFTIGAVYTARDWSAFELTKTKGLVDNGVQSKYAT